jgi:hypothetical protein
MQGAAFDDALPSETLAETDEFSGPGSVTFSTPTITNCLPSPRSFDTPGSYEIRLTAEDGEFAPRRRHRP